GGGVGADRAEGGGGRDDQVEIADEPPAAARDREATRDEQPARPAQRRREVDPGCGREPTCAGVLELLDEASGLLDAALGLLGARLGAPAEPLDLASHGVGERVLVGRLPAQELVPARQKFAV